MKARILRGSALFLSLLAAACGGGGETRPDGGTTGTGGTAGSTTATGSGTGGGAGDAGAGYVFPPGPTYQTQKGPAVLARITSWAPGIPGGIPQRTTVCATLSPSGGADDGPINDAIAACPENQVVALQPGSYRITNAILLKSGVVLRGSGGPGAGPSRQTRLVGTTDVYGPIVNLGPDLFPHPEGPTAELTADAMQGATSVTVSSAAGFHAGDLVLVDVHTDPANDQADWILDAPAGGTKLAYPYGEYNPQNSPPGSDSRGWFSRADRPVSQVMEIASITGSTITFSRPFHMTYDVAHGAQVTAFSYNGAESAPLENAGLEDVYVAGPPDPGGPTQYNDVVLTLAKHCWVKNVETDQSNGYGVGIDQSFGCVVRDSYVHSTINPTPGGAGYGIELSLGSADNLVENNISWSFDKVMVSRASGGGNVFAYNYMDDGWIAYNPYWVESGLNASHMTTPHFELFEGNLGFSLESDDTWGGSIFLTWLRNVATGRRGAWAPLNTYTFDQNGGSTGCVSQGADDYGCLQYADVQNRHAAGLQFGHVFYNFVGNVIGAADLTAAPQTMGLAYEATAPDWVEDPVPMWKIGWDTNGGVDQGAVNTTWRDGNWDAATKQIHWAGGPQEIPASLYLGGKPAFFGSLAWPWVGLKDPAEPYQTHPYQWYALSPVYGTCGTTGPLQSYPGYGLPAFLRFLALHGVEAAAAKCATESPASASAECRLLLRGEAP